MEWNTGVFDRTGEDTISRSAFYLVIGVLLTYGFAAMGLASQYVPLEFVSPDNPWIFWGFGLGLPILGILVSGFSGNAFISFIGFNLVVVPFGVLIGPLLVAFEAEYPGIVMQAVLLTGGTTGIMALLGILYPKVFESFGGVLTGALFALVAVGIAGFFIPALNDMMWIHYAAVAVFAGLMGYNFARASTIPSTLDNAVDVSVGIYLNLVNLLLRFLIILAKSRR